MNYKSVLLLKVPYCEYVDASAIKVQDFRTKNTFRPMPSLALAAICGFFDKYNKYGYNLKAVDINIEGYIHSKEPVDISIYPKLIENLIVNSTYDVLSISSMFVFNCEWVDFVVKLSRKHHPNAKIILGGGYPTIFPEKCLMDHDINDVIIGEGEDTFLHILNRYNNYTDSDFEEKFPFNGHAYKTTDGEVVITSYRNKYINMEELPMPSWEYLNIEKYFKNSGDRVLPIEASRGCPYSCAFCCTYLSWGKKLRYKTSEHMIEEICNINKKYKPDYFQFTDDNATFRREWIVDFLTKLLNLELDIKISFSNFSVKHLDEEIIDLLIKAKMTHFAIAIETGSLEMQKQIQKNIDFTKAKEVIKMMKTKKLIFIFVG